MGSQIAAGNVKLSKEVPGYGIANYRCYLAVVSDNYTTVRYSETGVPRCRGFTITLRNTTSERTLSGLVTYPAHKLLTMHDTSYSRRNTKPQFQIRAVSGASLNWRQHLVTHFLIR